MSGQPDELAALLLALNEMLVSEETLDDTLRRVAYLACESPIGAGAAGVTLQRDGGPSTPAHYGDAAPMLDGAQYAAGRGPCLTAYRSGETVRVDAIASESHRWPEYAAAAAAEGIRTSLSLPLVVSGQAVGALNLYSESPAPFTDDQVALALTFARQAAVAIANAEIYWRTFTLTQHLEAALENRDRIGQAKGVLIATHRVSADDAFEMLRTASQHLNIKLRRVADHVVLTGMLPDDANPITT